jgi:hypothetical protein
MTDVVLLFADGTKMTKYIDDGVDAFVLVRQGGTIAVYGEDPRAIATIRSAIQRLVGT